MENATKLIFFGIFWKLRKIFKKIFKKLEKFQNLPKKYDTNKNCHPVPQCCMLIGACFTLRSPLHIYDVLFILKLTKIVRAFKHFALFFSFSIETSDAAALRVCVGENCRALSFFSSTQSSQCWAFVEWSFMCKSSWIFTENYPQFSPILVENWGKFEGKLSKSARLCNYSAFTDGFGGLWVNFISNYCQWKKSHILERKKMEMEKKKFSLRVERIWKKKNEKKWGERWSTDVRRNNKFG